MTEHDKIKTMTIQPKNPSGIFIVFEGGDGAGKSTQVERLTTSLLAEGYDPVPTREPGGVDLAEKIRDLVLNNGSDSSPIDPTTETLLFAAARSAHVRDFIRPRLKAGKLVISDRYVDSSLAYQGAGRDLGIDNVAVINEIATDGLTPDLTILLDLGIKEARKRQQSRIPLRGQRPDRIEIEPDLFHERIRRAFLEQAEQYPEIYLVLNAAEPADFLAAQILENVKELLPFPEQCAPHHPPLKPAT